MSARCPASFGPVLCALPKGHPSQRGLSDSLDRHETVHRARNGWTFLHEGGIAARYRGLAEYIDAKVMKAILGGGSR